jgi:RIO-like serine/threonine protein kinase
MSPTGAGPGRASPPGALANGEGELLGRGYQGEVRLRRQADGGAVIVKRAIGRAPALALRRWMLRREHDIYQQLAGVPGVPRCHGMEQGDTLVLEFVAGRSLREVRLKGAERDAFFAALLEVIQAMHRAGVAHGDLKRKDNILVDGDGRPVLIDFGTAVTAPASRDSWRGAPFRLVARMDLNAWVKLKYQRQRADIAAEDLQFHRPTMTERVARTLRRSWRTLTLRRWRHGGR